MATSGFKAAALVAIRMAIVIVPFMLLQFPARWLRPHLYPDGVSFEVLVLVLLSLMVAWITAIYYWAYAPMRTWIKEANEKLESQRSTY